MSNKSRNVFISYGHNVFDSEVKKFKDILTEKLSGDEFCFFLDKDYLDVGDWESVINEHIKGSGWMLFVVSTRSVARSGYCLNELCRACEYGLKIIPIILDNAEVPLSINKFQRYSLKDIDGKITDESIAAAADTIADVLLGKKAVGYANEDIILKNALKPIDFGYDVSVHYDGFVGRNKAFEFVEDWLYSTSEEDDKICLIKAFPGFGKSAFSANCCWRFHDVIGAIHFCKYDNSDKADSKRIITSIAFGLAKKLSEYRQVLQKMQDLNDILAPSSQKNADRIFELLFVEALQDVAPDKPVLIVIDALDEAIWQGQINNELCNILRKYKKKLPSWLKILITSRGDNAILNSLQYVTKVHEITREDNKEDIKEYLRQQLKRLTDNEVSEDKILMLFEKSEGSFIYAREIIKHIKNYNRRLDEIEFFPTGLYELYTDSFKRIFEDVPQVQYKDVVPLLELTCVTPAELTVDFVMEYLRWGERETHERLDAISSLVTVRNKKIEIVHKTLKDWLISFENSGKFFISEIDGYKHMLSYLEKSYKGGNKFDEYCLKYYGMALIELAKRVKGEEKNQIINAILDLLHDKDYLLKRIRFLSLDTGLKMCIKEIGFVYENAKEKINDVYKSSAFIDIFAEYRRLLYNSGLFFALKKVGFSSFLATDKSNWGLEGEIGKIFYHYITEDFNTTISAITTTLKTFKKELSKKQALLAELYNVQGLALRKVVKFGDALKAFDNAIACASKCDYYFEWSLAHLIKSKIEIRTGDIKDCVRDGNEAVKYLNKAIEQTDSDERISNILFLAEDYRVLCDNMIWANDLDAAQDYIDKCQDIYIKYANTDRYYIRSQYTQILLQIVKGESDVSDKIDMIESKISASKYDMGQINIIKAIYNFVYNRSLRDVTAAARAAYQTYDEIDCPLEREEARCLYNLAAEKSGGMLLPEYKNAYINNWIEFFRKYVLRLYAEGRNA